MRFNLKVRQFSPWSDQVTVTLRYPRRDADRHQALQVLLKRLEKLSSVADYTTFSRLAILLDTLYAREREARGIAAVLNGPGIPDHEQESLLERHRTLRVHPELPAVKASA